MKKSLIFLVFCLLISLIFFAGCAKKEIVKEETATKESSAVAKQPGAQEAKAPAVKEAPASVPVEEETVKREAAIGAEESIFVDIHFDFDKFDLKSEARTILKKQADWLTKNRDYKVRIEGSCDERGTVEYNLALGERRAKEAMKYLAELGIDAKRIKTISYGKERPLDPGHNEEAWAKNRRDHFIIFAK
jgi:peptidoglycan-associated lipoprotein